MNLHGSFKAWMPEDGIDGMANQNAMQDVPRPQAAQAAAAAAAAAVVPAAPAAMAQPFTFTSHTNNAQAPATSSVVPDSWLEQLLKQRARKGTAHFYQAAQWAAKGVAVDITSAELVIQDKKTAEEARVALYHEEVLALCEAVKDGQLSDLRALHVRVTQITPLVESLMLALSAQLVYLSTKAVPSTVHMCQMSSLQRLELSRCQLTADVMEGLAALATLQEVTLDECAVDGDNSCYACRWAVVTLGRGCLGDLPRLPLAGTQELRLVCSVSGTGLGALPGASGWLLPYKGMITCHPGESTHMFTIVDMCLDMVPLVNCLVGVETLGFRSHLTPEVLQHVYQALPQAVTHLHFDEVSGLDWGQVWTGLPKEVTTITIRAEQGAPVSDHLSSMVVGAPSHINNIDVVFLKWRKAGVESYVRAHFDDVLLPQHLHFTVSIPGASLPVYSRP